MKRWLPIVTALVGVILGVALGYFAASVAAPESRPERQDSGGLSPSPNSRTHTGPHKEPVRAAPEMFRLPPVRKAGEAGIGDTEAPARDEIHGTIKLENGQPLAGVDIRATPHIPEQEPVRGLTLAEEIEAYTRRRTREAALERTTSTDANGRYVIKELDSDIYYAITPVLEHHDFRYSGSYKVTHHRPGTEVHFTAVVVVRVTVNLQLADGTAPDVGQISMSEDVDRPPSTGSWYWTPIERARSFKPGNWRLTFRAGENNEYTAEPVSIKLIVGEPAPVVTVMLVDKPCIVGRVIPPAGVSEHLSVRLLDVDGKLVPISGSRTRDGVCHTWSHDGWRFEFLDLTLGSYQLEVLMVDKSLLVETVTVGNAVTRVDLTVPVQDEKDYIVVRVVGPEGPVVDGLDFSITRAHSQGTAPVLNKGDGVYWLARDDSQFEEGTEGSYTIRVSSRVYGSRSSIYGRADSHTLEFWFVEPTYVNVTIVGFDDHPQRAKLYTALQRASDPQSDMPLGMRLSLGGLQSRSESRFGPIEPGDYEAQLIFAGESTRDSHMLERKAIRVFAGENKVELTAPTLYSFTLEIPEEYRQYPFSVVNIEDPAGGVSQQNWGEAEFVVGHLKAGEYLVIARHLGQMTVSLPAMDGRKVVFSPLLFNAFQVMRNRKDKPETLGLKQGDRVIEIDGNSLADFEKRQQLLLDSISKETTTWLVIRDGGRIAVTFDGREFNKSDWRLEPVRVD